jgi:ABC-type nitrate/sulfonate/bicarbonate transport system ATPase subunit
VWTRLRATIILVTHDVDEAVLLSDRVYVLTPRPARIAATTEVAIPRPRSLDSMAGPEFNRYRSELLAALRAAGGLPGAAVEGPVP